MGEPIRGYKRELSMPIKAEIHNRFDVEVIDSITGKIKQRAQAENIICSQLWTTMLTSGGQFFSHIHYGSGSGTPSAADTSLFTYVSAVSVSNFIFDADNAAGVYSAKGKISLSETTAVGVTLTEVGIGSGSNSSKLCTHAMLKDMNGNQISITKTNTDIINIYATVFLHRGFVQGINSGLTFMLDTSLPDNSYTNSGLIKWLLGTTTFPQTAVFAYCNGNLKTSASYIQSNYPTPSWNASTKTLTLKDVRLGAGTANISGGIKSINFCDLITLYSGVGWYPGTTISGEAIGTGDGSAKDYITKFGDISAAKIYVDGVQVTEGFTVDENMPYAIANIEKNFRLVDCYAPQNLSDHNGIPIFSGSNYWYAPESWAIYYNPYYSLGLKECKCYRDSSYVRYFTSDDMSNWVEIVSNVNNGNTLTIPEANRYHKYFKMLALKHDSYTMGGFVPYDRISDKNIHFNTAPASGAVITADYFTSNIGKDSDHVFDLTLTLTFGEYSA